MALDINVGVSDESMDSIREKWLIPREEAEVVLPDPARAEPATPDPERAQAPVMTEDEVDEAFAEPKKELTEDEVDQAFATTNLTFDQAVETEDIDSPLSFLELPSIDDEDFDLYPPREYKPLSEKEELDNAAVQAQTNLAASVKKLDDGDLVSKQGEDQAISGHYKDLKKWENPREKGLVRGREGEKFMPFESDEGRGPDKTMSTMEVGYGIKIHEKWLGDDKRYWPKVDGQVINIKEGLTREQADTMLRDAQEGSYKAAKKRLDKWDGMTEGEKVFWGDLTYNGGAGVIDKNPTAKKLANKGFTVEAMVAALDYIGSAGKLSRGLLNRRVTKYNEAAVEINGTPIIEEYRFSQNKVEVKFAHSFETDKVSPKFKKKNGQGGWVTIIDKKGAVRGKSIAKKMDRNHQFTG